MDFPNAILFKIELVAAKRPSIVAFAEKRHDAISLAKAEEYAWWMLREAREGRDPEDTGIPDGFVIKDAEGTVLIRSWEKRSHA